MSFKCPVFTIVVHALSWTLVSGFYGHEAILDVLSPNLFANPELDGPIPTTGTSYEWYTAGAVSTTTEVLTSGCYSGASCVHVSDRTANWKGLKNRVNATFLEPGERYWVSMFASFTAAVDSVPFNVPLIVRTKFSGSPESYNGILGLTGITVDERWLYFGIDFVTPGTPDTVDFYEFYLAAPIGVSYILDATSLRLIADPQWRVDAQNNIETIRQGTVNIEWNIPACYLNTDVEITVRQTDSLFGIGTVVDAAIINDDVADAFPGYNEQYRQYVLDHFSWASLKQSSQWSQMEDISKVEDDAKFTTVDSALFWLIENKKKVRGYSLHSNMQADQPGWVDQITDSAVFTAELERRIDYMTNRYAGEFLHWDVSIKHSADTPYLEEKTGNPAILDDLFVRTANADPAAALCLDNYISSNDPKLLAKHVNLAQKLLDNGAPVDAIAISGKFLTVNAASDIEVIKRRLDVISSLGLPIWITQLETTLPDVTARGLFLADVMMLLFGNPQVKGVIINGFKQFTKEWCPECDTPVTTFESNQAGVVWQNMVENAWRTSRTIRSPERADNVSFSAYYGTYTTEITYDSQVISTTTFDLTPTEPKDVMISFQCPPTP